MSTLKGILKYLEDVPEEKANGRAIALCLTPAYRCSTAAEGPHQLYACRRPILPEDKKRPEYEHGVACHHCQFKPARAIKTVFASVANSPARAR